MPRPATIPLIDWKAVFESGQYYASCIAVGESKENRDLMEALRQAQELEP